MFRLENVVAFWKSSASSQQCTNQRSLNRFLDVYANKWIEKVIVERIYLGEHCVATFIG